MKDFEQIIEALLFASPDPLTQKKINTIFDADPPELDKFISSLKKNTVKIKMLLKYYLLQMAIKYELSQNMISLLEN